MPFSDMQKFLVLGSVGITNVFLNEIVFKGNKTEQKSMHSVLKNNLRDISEQNTWFNIDDIDQNKQLSRFYVQYNDFSRSKSSYSTVSQKDIIVSKILNDKTIDRHTIPPEHAKVFNEVASHHLLIFQDVFIHFFENSNAVLIASVDLTILSLDETQYEALVMAIHAVFPKYFKKDFDEAIKQFQQVCMKYEDMFHGSETHERFIFQKSPRFTDQIRNETLKFSIFNHFFKQQSDYDCKLDSFFEDAENLKSNELMKTHEGTFRYGYTHSIIELKDTKDNFKDMVLKQRIPLIMVLANWASIRALSMNIDYIQDEYQQKGESRLNIFGMKKRREVLNRHLLIMKFITATLDGYNSSNNPVYFSQIESYRKAFFEMTSLERLERKIDVTKALSEEIDRIRKQRGEGLLEISLLLLTSLSIFTAIEVFFKIQGDYSPGVQSTIYSVALLVIGMFLIFHVIVNKMKS